jgi:hypothetical protein
VRVAGRDAGGALDETREKQMSERVPRPRNREQVRTLRKLTKVLAPRGFDGSYLITEASWRMLAEEPKSLYINPAEALEHRPGS